MEEPKRRIPTVTESDLDKYVDTRNCTYDDAYRHFGVKPHEIILESGAKNGSYSLPKSNEAENLTVNRPVFSDDLSEKISLKRAVHLGSLASQSVGRIKAIESGNPKLKGRYNSGDIEHISGQIIEYRKLANEELKKVGFGTLKAFGFKVDDFKERNDKELSDRVFNEVIGPEKPKLAKRVKLYKQIDKQITEQINFNKKQL